MEINDEITDELNDVSNSKWKSEMRYYDVENGPFGVVLMTYYKNGKLKFSTANGEIDNISTTKNLTDDEIKVISKYSCASFEQLKRGLFF